MTRLLGYPILAIYIWLGCIQPIIAQNTWVMGKLAPQDLVDKIELEVNQLYLTDQKDDYSSIILEDGSFMFTVRINEPQLVSLKCANKEALLYLEPGDTLIINADVSKFQSNLRFEGRAGANNQLLYAYFNDNPPELDPFKIIQHRYGNLWYSNSPRMEDLMLTSDPPSFIRYMLMKKEKALDLLHFYAKRNVAITDDFKAFLSSEITYSWAYHMLLYGHVFKNKYELPQKYFNFIAEVPVDNRSIGNYWLRQYLLALINHYNQSNKTKKNPFVAQYDLATKMLYGKGRSFVQSEMIVKALRAAQFDEILPKYHEFSQNNPYPLFEEKVISVYQKTIRYAPGSQAPDFVLADLNGEDVHLSEFRGKVVYLNFWASWCRPCIAKMRDMRPIQKELESEGVVFLNVSLDKNETSWQNKIQELNLGGVNVRTAGPTGQSLLREYEVNILPQYYLIDKSGAFAEKPKQFDLLEIRNALSQLAHQASN